jgi:hypothetical protein
MFAASHMLRVEPADGGKSAAKKRSQGSR